MHDINNSAAETPARSVLTRPVVLVGLMGAGKTSVGLRLAAALGVDLVDSDTEIEAAAAMTIPEIFEKYGEAHFRDGEQRVIARLLDARPAILSVGGGAFMNEQTRAAIREKGVSVWLKADLNLLVQRTSGRSHRPLLNNGDPRDVLADLIAKRHPIYAKADVTVESRPRQTHEQMATRIIKALTAHGRSFAPEPS